MRVIAGSARGVPLKGPPGAATRPTSDKVRGAIFDALAPDLRDARVLDLYAGTGALGVEALSRGAASCLFVERAAVVCRVIDANLRTTRLADRATVWPLPVSAALDRLERSGGFLLPPMSQPPYNIIVLDPPYDDAEGLAMVERVSRSGVLAPEAIVVFEHGKRLAPPTEVGPLRLRRTRLYGDTAVTIWQRQEQEG